MSAIDSYNKGLDTLNMGISRFNSLLSTNKAKTSRIITTIVLSLLILGLFGCFNFITWTFDFSKIITLEYWTNVSTKVGIAICSFNIGINFNWHYVIERSIDLKENIELYDILIKQKDDDNFDYYVNHIFNIHLKRRAYINKINRKIHRLNKFAKDRDIELYSKKIPLGVKDYDTLVKDLEANRSVNKYCIRRKQLEYLKSEEYINENIDSLGVKYSRVDAQLFNLEIDSKPKQNNFVVGGNVGFGRAKASSHIVLPMVLISMFTASLLISINQQEFIDQLHAVLFFLCSFLIDVGMVVWNIFRGTRSVSAIISEQLTIPYANRNTVLKKYIAWKEENSIQTSVMQQKINKLIDEEHNVVEVSEEDYKKMTSNNTNK